MRGPHQGLAQALRSASRFGVECTSHILSHHCNPSPTVGNNPFAAGMLLERQFLAGAAGIAKHLSAGFGSRIVEPSRGALGGFVVMWWRFRGQKGSTGISGMHQST